MASATVPIFHRNATIRWIATGIGATALVASIMIGVYWLRFVEGAWGWLLSSFLLIVLWYDQLPRPYLVSWTCLALLGTAGMIMIHSIGIYLFPAAVIASIILLPFTVRRIAPPNATR